MKKPSLKNTRFRIVTQIIQIVKKELIPFKIKDSIWVKSSVFLTFLVIVTYAIIIFQNKAVISEAKSQRELSEKTIKQSQESIKLLERSLVLMEKQTTANELMAQFSRAQNEMNIAPSLEVLPKNPDTYGHKDSIDAFNTFNLSIVNNGSIDIKNINIKVYYYFCQRKLFRPAEDSSNYIIKSSESKELNYIYSRLRKFTDDIEIFPISFPIDTTLRTPLNIGKSVNFRLNVRNAYGQSKLIRENLRKKYVSSSYLRIIINAQRLVDSKNFLIMDRLYEMYIGYGNAKSPIWYSVLSNGDYNLNEPIQPHIHPVEVKLALDRLQK